MMTFLDAAIDAAKSAGDVLMRSYEKPKEIQFKAEVDLVTAMDRASEQVIIEKLLGQFPNHGVVAEETGARKARSEYRWIVDPLDGTTNYAHDLPLFSVSIALECRKEIIVGVVYDPVRPELFYAEKNGGAYLNGKPIHVSEVSDLGRALLVTGFPVQKRQQALKNVELFGAFTLRSQGVRRLGSAALDLCYVACGRFDAHWEFRLHAWDTAAGSLIVSEAGGKISDFGGQSFDPFGTETLASNGKIHVQMMEVLAPFRDAPK
ncbi:MAG: inositol monophosphatase family protein [Acidobacteriia bacterium]|nr:inositol monophosphatase family protein [Terriglobia bacterium]